MFKNVKNGYRRVPKLQINIFPFILTMAFILSFIENIPSFINVFLINKYNNFNFYLNIFSLIREGILVFFLVLTLLWICSFSKYLLKLVVVIFLNISAIFIYILVAYRTIIDEVLFVNLIQANKGEISEMLTFTPVLVWFSLGFLPSLWLIFFIKINKVISNYNSWFSKQYWKTLFKQVSLFIILPLCLSIGLIFILGRTEFITNRNIAKNALAKYMPVNYIAAYFQYQMKIDKSLKAAHNTPKLYELFDFSFNSSLKKEPLTIVLVIGESARSKDQAYNGYYRDTNKYTKNIPGLVYLKDVKSCNTYTIASVPCMLSYKTRKEFSLPTTETGLISVFGALGFKTYWISTQTAYDKGINPIFKAAVEASEFSFINALRPYLPSGGKIYDGITVNTLVKKAIDEDVKHKLIVFQLSGSHIQYKERFPADFRVYTPSAQQNKSSEAQIVQNDYDNSLLYTDYILSILIDYLKEKNSMLLYMSDHGESLPLDNSCFLIHSAPYDIAPYEQTHIAALMWFSEGMQRLLPYALENVKKYSSLHISHDYIFSTLLGCIGVKSKVINDNLNLCIPNGLLDAKNGKYY